MVAGHQVADQTCQPKYKQLENGGKSIAGNACRVIASEKNTEKRWSVIQF